MRGFFRLPEKRSRTVNHQNKEENPYAPPKTALDFKPPEKGTKKQRIARVLLGAFTVPVIMTMVSFFVWYSSWINERVLDVIMMFFMGLLAFILLFIIPSIIFSAIIEYLSSNQTNKIIISLIAGVAIPYSTFFIGFLIFDGQFQLWQSNLSKWFICGEFATLISLFIMHKHRIRYDRQALSIQSI
ncbi:MAG: hypothetical protein J6M43_05985 [Neisseriaceae bacterium]|nr:hypothetical protein [Neisseriaceae bacterium]